MSWDAVSVCTLLASGSIPEEPGGTMPATARRTAAPGAISRTSRTRPM
ncbi:hypothetical protein [Actinomadura sp. B10D3]